MHSERLEPEMSGRMEEELKVVTRTSPGWAATLYMASSDRARGHRTGLRKLRGGDVWVSPMTHGGHCSLWGFLPCISLTPQGLSLLRLGHGAVPGLRWTWGSLNLCHCLLTPEAELCPLALGKELRKGQAVRLDFVG